MDNTSFNDWLELYGKAWTQRSPNLIKKLFTDDAKYSDLKLKKIFLLNTKLFQ
jgi:hypothetical protein